MFRESEGIMNKGVVYTVVAAFLFAIGIWGTSVLAAEVQKKMQDNGYSDRAFLSAMIGHHNETVALARHLSLATDNGKARAWAEAVIVEQAMEIREMERLLNALGGLDLVAHDAMRQRGMAAPPESGIDGTFARGMFERHASSVEMALTALKYSHNPEVVRLADRIIGAQSKEMADFRFWSFAR